MRNYTFSKAIRLRKKQDIEGVFKRGAFCGLGLIRVKYLSTTLKFNRYLISVSKKVGHSPYRNSIKRLLREAIRLHNSEHERHYDICLFVTQRPQNPVTFQYVENKIITLFTELHRHPEKQKT